METTLTKPTTTGMTNFTTKPLDPFMTSNFFDVPMNNGIMETVPSVNIREEKNDYVIEVAAPGLKKNDFEIGVAGNIVTIATNLNTAATNTATTDTDSTLRNEFDFTCFTRTVALPEFADTTSIVAKYECGVLTLTVTKKADAKKMGTTKIKVN